MNTFTEVCSQLGVPIADDQTEGPSTRLTYLGFLIDIENMLIQIPVEKVQELLYSLNKASKRKNIALRQLQSLCGSLACCARALPAGRAFNRRLYLACHRTRKRHHLKKITKLCRVIY
jgi:hypothetical protein